MFQGSIVALITPFKNNQLDEKSFEKLIEFQISNGSNALVPVGTTGESPTLSRDEHMRAVQLCVDITKGRIPVIAGAGSNNTKEAIEFTIHAKEVGADAALSVLPYYNKPSQAGLKAHYTEIANAVDIPLIIYNIPGRSVICMDNDIMTDLSKHKNIIGVKDATADLMRPTELRSMAGADFCQLSGDDFTLLPFLAAGGHGCISVAANVAPKLCRKFFEAWWAKDLDKALELHQKLLPLYDALFCTTSPAPVKYAASLLGLCENEIRLPLVPVNEAEKKIIEKAMSDLELI